MNAGKIAFALSLVVVLALSAYYTSGGYRPFFWVAFGAAALAAGFNVRAVLPPKVREPTV